MFGPFDPDELNCHKLPNHSNQWLEGHNFDCHQGQRLFSVSLTHGIMDVLSYS